MRMKRIAVLLVCLLLAGCAGRISAPAEESAAPSAAAESQSTPVEEAIGAQPDQPAEPADADAATYTGITFSLTTLAGETIDESYISSHKLTMVNYWATWCGPCVSEIPSLSAIAEEYADKGFAILGVLLWDEDTEGAKAFLQEKGVTYPCVVAEGALLTPTESFRGVPTTLFFNEKGEQIGTATVGAKNSKNWKALIDTLLAEVG